MFDYITVGSLIGLVVFGVLWNKSSDKVWYMDVDNAPVSFKAIFFFMDYLLARPGIKVF